MINCWWEKINRTCGLNYSEGDHIYSYYGVLWYINQLLNGWGTMSPSPSSRFCKNQTCQKCKSNLSCLIPVFQHFQKFSALSVSPQPFSKIQLKTWTGLANWKVPFPINWWFIKTFSPSFRATAFHGSRFFAQRDGYQPIPPWECWKCRLWAAQPSRTMFCGNLNTCGTSSFTFFQLI